MIVGVNTRFLLSGKLEGIGLYTHELLRRMVVSHPDVRFIFFFDRPYSDEFVYASNVTPVIVYPPARHPLLWWIWFEIALPRALKKHRVDIFFSPDGFLSLRTKVPQLMIMHDLAYLHYPEYVPLWVRKFYHHFIPKYLLKARLTGCVSEATKQDILKHFPLAPEKLFVAYNGCRTPFHNLSKKEITRVRTQYADGYPFFLFVGALHPRKNVDRMLQAYDLYRKRGGGIRRFVIVGRKAWMTERLEQNYRKMQFQEEVIFSGYLPLQELARVTGAAFALLYLSLFEGFGVPLLEAMNSEIPIICSNISSMPEVTGNAALHVAPSDIEAIASAMHTLSSDEKHRLKLIEQGKKQREKFSWDQSADILWRKILYLYEKSHPEPT